MASPVAIWGSWHLGSVHAAGLAELGNRVLVTDPDPSIVAGLRRGEPPLYELGLAEMLARHLASGRLSVHDPTDPVLSSARMVFLAADTEIDDDDRVALAGVEHLADVSARMLRAPATLVVASQVPVGTTEALRSRMARIAGFDLPAVHLPENLRLGSAMENFLRPERIVVGADCDEDADAVVALLHPACEVLRMSVRSAEMSKHALNAYLATLISFASEMADLCEAVGADAWAVERALRADRRVSPAAPLRPGFGFAGGTLGRDVQSLRSVARERGVSSSLMDAVLSVNRSRVARFVSKLAEALGGLRGRAIALLGLTYKPGTDTLRRSIALEIGRALTAEGVRMRAFDPRAHTLPPGSPPIELAPDPFAAADGCDALVVVTEWPEFRALDWAAVGKRLRRPLVFDLKGLLDPATPGIDLRRIGVRP